MKKKIFSFIQLILIIIIIYSLYNIASYYYGRYKAGKEFDAYKDLVTDSLDEMGEEEVAEQESPDKAPGKKGEFDIFSIMTREDFKKYKSKYDQVAKQSLDKFKVKNEDIVSYINIPGMSVKYPMVYKDNDFYLRRNLAKEYSWAGSIFIEETNKPDFSDMNTVIYGHNMSNSYIKTAEMFDPIIKYEDQGFVDSRKEHFIDIFTDKGVERYKIFSAYYVDAAADYRTSNMQAQDWTLYLEKLKSRSLADFGPMDFGEDSKVITLSTCDNVNEDGRFAVHAIRIDI
ncbi:MAG: class B sortase [Tissierellia bacterium]|nr:class B sortase [Tissierellia bacterium]